MRNPRGVPHSACFQHQRKPCDLGSEALGNPPRHTHPPTCTRTNRLNGGHGKQCSNSQLRMSLKVDKHLSPTSREVQLMCMWMACSSSSHHKPASMFPSSRREKKELSNSICPLPCDSKYNCDPEDVLCVFRPSKLVNAKADPIISDKSLDCSFCFSARPLRVLAPKLGHSDRLSVRQYSYKSRTCSCELSSSACRSSRSLLKVLIKSVLVSLLLSVWHQVRYYVN